MFCGVRFRFSAGGAMVSLFRNVLFVCAFLINIHTLFRGTYVKGIGVFLWRMCKEERRSSQMNVVKLVPELNPTADRLDVCVLFFFVKRIKYINEHR